MRQTGKIIINKVEKSKRPDNADSKGKQSLTKFQIFEFCLISLNRFLIGFVTIYMCWMCMRVEFQDIPFHALLCTIGFVCLMSEGLMAHYRANACRKRSEKTQTHWVLQVFGSVVGLVGVAIKICIEDVHFHTVHGIVGLATTFLLLISLLSGLSALNANEMKDCMQPLLNKACHNIWGLLTYTLVMLAMYTAYDTDIFVEYSLDAATYNDFKWLIKASIAGIWLLTSYGPLWCLIYSKLWNSCC